MWIVEQIKLRNKLLKVSSNALQEYRNTVKGNMNSPKLEVRKKLTRNVLLSKDTVIEKDGIKTYHYGNLTIAVEGKTILFIRNHKGKLSKFNKDSKRYYELNRELQIKE